MEGTCPEIMLTVYNICMLRIALLQIAPCGSLEKNLDKGLSMCRKAMVSSPDIILFPEMWSNGYDIISRPYAEWKNDAVYADSSFLEAFRECSRELSTAIAITFLEKTDTKPMNSMIVFDRYGNEVLHYSKVHTCAFGAEHDLRSGDGFYVSDLDTDKGIIRIGGMICFDREFPESARILMLEGAELILVPNACPIEINRLSQLRARSYENMCAIATCNYPSGVPDCNGHSTVFDGIAYLPQYYSSRDTCIFESGEEEGIFISDLDIGMLREYRKREVHGNAYRHPDRYQRLIEEEIRGPFIRLDRTP